MLRRDKVAVAVECQFLRVSVSKPLKKPQQQRSLCCWRAARLAQQRAAKRASSEFLDAERIFGLLDFFELFFQIFESVEVPAVWLTECVCPPSEFLDRTNFWIFGFFWIVFQNFESVGVPAIWQGVCARRVKSCWWPVWQGCEFQLRIPSPIWVLASTLTQPHPSSRAGHHKYFQNEFKHLFKTAVNPCSKRHWTPVPTGFKSSFKTTG